jgi:soluble lytic murein transglycosylase-like protein
LQVLAAGKTGATTTASGFEAALNSAASQGNAAAASDSAAELAAALRLELLRSVASLGDASGDDGPDFSAIEKALTSQNATPTASASATTAAPAAALSAYRQEDGLEGIIDRASQRYQVAPQLIRAVIRAESGFDTKAVSPAGAQGLMQLMPETAAQLGVNDPFNAEQNVMGGTRYLRQLLDKYNGRLDTALAAYNWGPGHVDRGTGSLPRETRNYIDRIQGYLAGSVG